ncbi:hypothetical protein [Parasediminibacterium sp. JCM 36343]|uniref:hypothetical protein n=1 Tax=Parasediminibacterium sp. JCM 36343 TaxID=3374279 RepID=UPI00397837EF
MKKNSIVLIALLVLGFTYGYSQTKKPLKTYRVRTAKKPSSTTFRSGKSPAIYPNPNPASMNVVYQYIDTTNPNGENQFPSTGNIGIGTRAPQAPLEIVKGVGNVAKKNILLQLSNIWADGGQNEPSMMFSNGDISNPKNTSYWTVGARVSGDNVLKTPQTFKVCFKAPGADTDQEYFSINAYQGKVKIGNVNELIDGYKLFVEEGILSEKVKVAVKNSEDWYDNVFTPSYKRMSIQDLDGFIKQYKHLPDVPTTETVMKDGIDLGKMNGILLKKLEELTLDVIDMKKELDETKRQLDELKMAKNRK